MKYAAPSVSESCRVLANLWAFYLVKVIKWLKPCLMLQLHYKLPYSLYHTVLTSHTHVLATYFWWQHYQAHHFPAPSHLDQSKPLGQHRNKQRRMKCKPGACSQIELITDLHGWSQGSPISSHMQFTLSAPAQPCYGAWPLWARGQILNQCHQSQFKSSQWTIYTHQACQDWAPASSSPLKHPVFCWDASHSHWVPCPPFALADKHLNI